MSDFGALIRTTREQRGETGVALSQRLGVAHSTLVRMERGQLSNPPEPDLFWRLSDALSLPSEQMLEALGYAQLGEQQENPALAALRPIIGSRSFTDREIDHICEMVRRVAEIMEGARDERRG